MAKLMARAIPAGKLMTFSVGHFAVVVEGDVPASGFAIRGESVFRDGLLLGTLVSIEDEAESVYVGHTFAPRSVKGPSGPYSIQVRCPE